MSSVVFSRAFVGVPQFESLYHGQEVDVGFLLVNFQEFLEMAHYLEADGGIAVAADPAP